MKDFPRHHTFYQQGEKLPPDQAYVMMIVSGTVVFKARGIIIDTLSDGAIIGEDALRGDAYQHTAVSTCPKARMLAISVADYTTQFFGGRSLREKADKAHKNSGKKGASDGHDGIQPPSDQPMSEDKIPVPSSRSKGYEAAC